jgi:hypothetical protein
MSLDPMSLHEEISAIFDLGTQIPARINCGEKTGWKALGHFSPGNAKGSKKDESFEFPVFRNTLSNHQILIHDPAVQRGRAALAQLYKKLVSATPCLDNYLTHITVQVIKTGNDDFAIDMSMNNHSMMRNSDLPERLTNRLSEIQRQIGHLPLWDGAATWHVIGSDIPANNAADARTIFKALSLRKSSPPPVEGIWREPI